MQGRSRRGWEIPEAQATAESAWLKRRTFLKALGLGGLAGALLPAVGLRDALGQAADATPTAGLYPAGRNATYRVARELTRERVAATHNNFYEFTTNTAEVWKLAQALKMWPWSVEIAGHVRRRGLLDVEDLIKSMPLEERVYRFRCVEAWAMTVPWTGFPLRKLIERVEPTRKARYVRFVTFYRPSQAVNQRLAKHYPWPYYEGLRMDEAMNELTLVATGIYGRPLPPQHGGPLRIVTPWKYGYKSPKSIVRIEFVEEQPKTFWEDLQPREYPFQSNVNPHVPHPRWSQATEQLIGTADRVPTRLFNGYEEFVGAMYPAEPRG